MRRLIAGFLLLSLWAPADSDERPITVLNPRGLQPPIRLVPLAQRPASLDDKTVYIIDVKYPRTQPFVNQLRRNLQARYPRTRWIVKRKSGNYFDDDPSLWSDAQANAAAAIVLLGH